MANRSWSTKALILSLKDYGEAHREASLLICDNDCSCSIIKASLFGGPKAKLKGLISPFHTGTIWLYSNPVKNSNKITDFKVSDYRMGLRDNLIRICSASLAVEIVLKLKGNIDWLLINSFLKGISISSEDECRKALLRFMWRIIIMSGVAPNITCCGKCGGNIGKEVFCSPCNNFSPDSSLFFVPGEDVCLCSSCIQNRLNAFKLSKESLIYLFSIQYLPPKQSRILPLSNEAYGEIKSFLFYLMEQAINSKFQTLENSPFLF